MKTQKMKNILLISVAVLGLTVSSLAQGPGKFEDKKEKVDAMKIGFITQQMNLTPEEAQKFWPVYNQMDDELDKLRKERKLARMEAKVNFDEMADADVEKLINDEITSRQKELDIQKKYVGQFKSILPVKKVAQFYRAEEMFKRRLLEKMQEKKPQ